MHHILYISEADYNVDEPEPKDVEDSEPEVKEAEVEELPIETLVDLPTEPTWGIVIVATYDVSLVLEIA